MRPENLLLIALIGGMLFLMFSRGRKQQREAQQTRDGLTVGAEVMTTAGLYATVVEIDDQVVVLETAPGQESRWDKRAIARVLPASASSDYDDEDEDDAYDEDDGVNDETDEGAGARLEHGTEDGETGSSSRKDTSPPDRA